MVTNRETDCFSFARSFTLSNLYLVSDFSSSLWYAVSVYADDFEEQYWFMRRLRCSFRVDHHSWWKEELPSDEEYTEALKTLKQIGWAADYIITHCAPNSVVKKLNPDYDLDQLTAFLEKIRRKAKFHYWLFGHYHDNKIINERYVLLWEQIVQIK